MIIPGGRRMSRCEIRRDYLLNDSPKTSIEETTVPCTGGKIFSGSFIVKFSESGSVNVWRDSQAVMWVCEAIRRFQWIWGIAPKANTVHHRRCYDERAMETVDGCTFLEAAQRCAVASEILGPCLAQTSIDRVISSARSAKVSVYSTSYLMMKTQKRVIVSASLCCRAI